MPEAPHFPPCQVYNRDRLQTRLFAEKDAAFPGKLHCTSPTRLPFLTLSLEGPWICS